MESMSPQEKLLLVLALVLCAALLIYAAVTQSRAVPEEIFTAEKRIFCCGFTASDGNNFYILTEELPRESFLIPGSTVTALR